MSKELTITDGVDKLELIQWIRKDREWLIDVFDYEENYIYCLNKKEAKQLRDYLNSVLGDE